MQDFPHHEHGKDRVAALKSARALLAEAWEVLRTCGLSGNDIGQDALELIMRKDLRPEMVEAFSTPLWEILGMDLTQLHTPQKLKSMDRDIRAAG